MRTSLAKDPLSGSLRHCHSLKRPSFAMPPKRRLTQGQRFRLLALTQQRSERGDAAASAALRSELQKRKPQQLQRHTPTAYVQPTESSEKKEEREKRREDAEFIKACEQTRAQLGPPCCEAAALLPTAAAQLRNLTHQNILLQGEP